MPTVFLSSETNSTTFTTCCECAICDDESRCPRCKQEITPPGRERWSYAYGRIKNGGWYGNPYGNLHRPG